MRGVLFRSCNGSVEYFSVRFSEAEPRLIKAMQQELQRRGDAAATRLAFADASQDRSST